MEALVLIFPIATYEFGWCPFWDECYKLTFHSAQAQGLFNFLSAQIINLKALSLIVLLSLQLRGRCELCYLPFQMIFTCYIVFTSFSEQTHILASVKLNLNKLRLNSLIRFLTFEIIDITAIIITSAAEMHIENYVVCTESTFIP